MSCCSEDDLMEVRKMGVYDRDNIGQAIAVIIGFFGVFLVIFFAVMLGG